MITVKTFLLVVLLFVWIDVYQRARRTFGHLGSQYALDGTVSDIVRNNTDQSKRLVINDPTISLDPNVHHVWLLNNAKKEKRPRYKLLLTDIGWNHPNRTYGLEFVRYLRQRELLQATVDHPHFDPTVSWTDVINGHHGLNESDTRYYIFLDVEMCFESNYPHYGREGKLLNLDSIGGRSLASESTSRCFDIKYCSYLRDVLAVIEKYPNATVVAYNCRGDGPSTGYKTIKETSHQLSLVTESAHETQLRLKIDQGLPPGPLNVVEWSAELEREVYSCKAASRRYLITFAGSVRNKIRSKLVTDLTNNHDMILADLSDYKRYFGNSTFHEILLSSVFGASPRGDNLYSYRFTEVLSAGSIPVVHADQWVLPFHKDFVDWIGLCAVIIPESKVYKTERILRNMTKEEICRRQKNCFNFYHKYMSSAKGTIEGIIDGLEHHFQNKRPMTDVLWDSRK